MADAAEKNLAMCSKDPNQVKRNTMLLTIRNLSVLVMMSAKLKYQNLCDPLYEAEESYCRELIRSARVAEFRSIKTPICNRPPEINLIRRKFSLGQGAKKEQER